MPTIGIDCNITLTHADINAGEPYGFLLVNNKAEFGPHFAIQRTVDSDGVTSIRCYFDVLLADDAIQPNGKPHTQSRSEMYAMIIAYLAKTEGVLFNTINGLIYKSRSLWPFRHRNALHQPGSHRLYVQQCRGLLPASRSGNIGPVKMGWHPHLEYQLLEIIFFIGE